MLRLTISSIMARNNKAHGRLDHCDFLKRYPAGKVTAWDHSFHLSQLIAIYGALERHIAAIKAKPAEERTAAERYVLTIAAGELGDRVRHAKADREALTGLLTEQQRDEAMHVLPETSTLVEMIAAATPQALTGHFLVRVLGDLFGGQSIGHHVLGIYDKAHMAAASAARFYHFDKATSRTMTACLRDTEITAEDRDAVLDATAASFAAHEALFAAAEVYRSRCHPEAAAVTCPLPSCDQMLWAGAFVVAGIAAAAVTATEYGLL